MCTMWCPGVGLSDRPGQQVLVPVLVVVAGPWEAVGGRHCPAHLEPLGSQESGSPLLQHQETEDVLTTHCLM